MINLKKTLDNNKIILLLVDSGKYNTMSKAITKFLSGKKVAYITLNKTANAIMDNLKKDKVEQKDFIFVDAITKSIMGTAPTVKNCSFVSSPRALSEISLAITKILSKKYDYIIFDSLTNLLIYEGKAPVAKFLSSIINKIRTTNTSAIFYSLEMKQQQELIQEASMFVDEVVHYK